MLSVSLYTSPEWRKSQSQLSLPLKKKKGEGSVSHTFLVNGDFDLFTNQLSVRLMHAQVLMYSPRVWKGLISRDNAELGEEQEIWAIDVLCIHAIYEQKLVLIVLLFANKKIFWNPLEIIDAGNVLTWQSQAECYYYPPKSQHDFFFFFPCVIGYLLCLNFSAVVFCAEASDCIWSRAAN